MAAELTEIVPVLPVKDARASVAFYTGALGFAVDWEHQFEPGMPLFVSLSRGRVRVFLSEHRGEGAPRTLVYVYTDDVDALHQEVLAAGGTVAEPPNAKPWAMKEMIVLDPDGHRLRFGMEFPNVA